MGVGVQVADGDRRVGTGVLEIMEDQEDRVGGEVISKIH